MPLVYTSYCTVHTCTMHHHKDIATIKSVGHGVPHRWPGKHSRCLAKSRVGWSLDHSFFILCSDKSTTVASEPNVSVWTACLAEAQLSLRACISTVESALLALLFMLLLIHLSSGSFGKLYFLRKLQSFVTYTAYYYYYSPLLRCCKLNICHI